jgi:hypothetical protein
VDSSLEPSKPLPTCAERADRSYAPGVVPASEAAKAGYGQILWLSGDDHTLTEVSSLKPISWAKLMNRSVR